MRPVESHPCRYINTLNGSMELIAYLIGHLTHLFELRGQNKEK